MDVTAAPPLDPPEYEAVMRALATLGPEGQGFASTARRVGWRVAGLEEATEAWPPDRTSSWGDGDA